MFHDNTLIHVRNAVARMKKEAQRKAAKHRREICNINISESDLY